MSSQVQREGPLFGRRGHRVALVARNRDRLGDFRRELAGEGIDSSVYVGDLGDPVGFDDLVSSIVTDFGPIDIAVYQTTAPAPTVASPLDVTAETERLFVEQVLLTPIEAVRTLLAPMIGRGSGALLVAMGASAVRPIPYLAQVGPPLAALRQHLLGVAEATAPLGVRVGVLIIGGLVLGSEIQRTSAPDAGPDFPGALDPDALAALYDELLAGNGDPERRVGPYANPDTR